MPPQRRLIFLNHANPEDNVFTVWLGARLVAAGYEVWSDVTRLFGGEEFWEDIEEAIRNHCAKVIVILSRKATNKKGVLDEINLAVTVERSQKLSGFVVPVRIDDLPFSEIKANIARKMVIDFFRNWAAGLHALIKVLERDGVAKTRSTSGTDIAAWCQRHFRSEHQVKPVPETLLSNWFRISRMPDAVHLSDIGVVNTKITDTANVFRLPWFRYARLIGSFASAADLQPDLPPEILLTARYRIETNRFLDGKPKELPGMSGKDARKIVTGLVRETWDRSMAARGLLPYALASGVTAWYHPAGVLDKNVVRYADHDGVTRRKNLVGRSSRRNVNWHLAMQAQPVLGRMRRIILRPHVVFSEDGCTPLDNADRMHALRRGFCRNWWNPQWRGLTLAYAAVLAGPDGQIALPAGGDGDLLIDARPIAMEAPVSFIEPGEVEAADFEVDPPEPDDDAFDPDDDEELDDPGAEADTAGDEG